MTITSQMALPRHSPAPALPTWGRAGAWGVYSLPTRSSDALGTDHRGAAGLGTVAVASLDAKVDNALSQATATATAATSIVGAAVYSTTATRIRAGLFTLDTNTSQAVRIGFSRTTTPPSPPFPPPRRSAPRIRRQSCSG